MQFRGWTLYPWLLWVMAVGCLLRGAVWCSAAKQQKRLRKRGLPVDAAAAPPRHALWFCACFVSWGLFWGGWSGTPQPILPSYFLHPKVFFSLQGTKTSKEIMRNCPIPIFLRFAISKKQYFLTDLFLLNYRSHSFFITSPLHAERWNEKLDFFPERFQPIWRCAPFILTTVL